MADAEAQRRQAETERLMQTIRRAQQSHRCPVCGRRARQWAPGLWALTCSNRCMDVWILGKKRADHFAHMQEKDDDDPADHA